MPLTQSASSAIPTPVELLQNLIRFDTTNPPGNEGACIGYIRDLQAAAGIESTIPAPVTFDFARTVHAADERSPVDAVAHGANAIYKALQRANA